MMSRLDEIEVRLKAAISGRWSIGWSGSSPGCSVDKPGHGSGCNLMGRGCTCGRDEFDAAIEGKS